MLFLTVNFERIKPILGLIEDVKPRLKHERRTMSRLLNMSEKLLLSKPELPTKAKAKLWLNFSDVKPPLKITVNGKTFKIIRSSEKGFTLIDLDPESEISVSSI